MAHGNANDQDQQENTQQRNHERGKLVALKAFMDARRCIPRGTVPAQGARVAGPKAQVVKPPRTSFQPRACIWWVGKMVGKKDSHLIPLKLPKR